MFSSRDILVKIADGGTPVGYVTVGAARTAALHIDNRPLDVTALDGDVAAFIADGGVQQMTIALDGVFRAGAALLHGAARDRLPVDMQFCFGNGDTYAAVFVIDSYARGGTFDGLETFTATLSRSGHSDFSGAA